MTRIMKLRQYILGALMGVAVFFTSCSNDDIVIAYESQVAVNSSSVINSFEAVNPGDLELLDKGYKLRTRLLFYDTNGQLAASDSVFLNNWTEQAKLQPRLAPGVYTVYAISDVVRHNGTKTTLEYWALNNRDKLGTVRLTDTGWLGHERKIMGIGHQTLTVTEAGGNASIDVKPAGALFVYLFKNIHRFSDVTELEIAVQKTGDYLTFDERGNYTTSFKSGGTSFTAYRLVTITPGDFQGHSVYGYEFELPAKNYALKYKVNYTSSGQNKYMLSNGFVIDLEPGAQWLYTADLAETSNNFAEELVLAERDEDVKACGAGLTDWSVPQLVSKRNSVYLKEYE